jgi:uncharacterized membrane protein YfcA
LVTGVLTGFLGIGGGFVIVPVLVLLLGLPMQAAVGTSLAIIALTSAAAFAAHVATGDIDWAVASSFAGIAILGALAGRRIGSRLDQRQLAAAFTALLVVVAVLLVAENVYALVTG